MPFETQMDGQLAFLSGPRTVDTDARHNCLELIQRNMSPPRRHFVQYFSFLDQEGERVEAMRFVWPLLQPCLINKMNRRWTNVIKTETTIHTRILHDTKLSEFITVHPVVFMSR